MAQGKAKRTAVGYKIIELLELYPHQPSRTIARLAHQEFPKLFTSVNQARNAVMFYRGRAGVKNRKNCTRLVDGAQFNQADHVIPVPPPLKEGDPWHIKRLSFERAVCLYDIHFPYHDQLAVQTAVSYAKRKLNPDCVILGGDMMDFYALSSFERDPNQRNVVDELRMGERFLEVLREEFPRARIIYMEGNHEERLTRYVWRNVPEFAQLEELTLAQLLHMDDYGVELVDGKKPLLAGAHLHILHGHEFGGFMTNPVNPARGLFLRGKVNAICGHFHQTSQHTEPGLGSPVSTWSSGCLCNLHPRYRPINKWDAGFLSIDLHRKEWSVRSHKIINGTVV